MVDFAAIAGADLSYMVTLGNEAMITAGHVLDFLVEDESTAAIVIFMQTATCQRSRVSETGATSDTATAGTDDSIDGLVWKLDRHTVIRARPRETSRPAP
jgi:hypothetical protein